MQSKVQIVELSETLAPVWEVSPPAASSHYKEDSLCDSQWCEYLSGGEYLALGYLSNNQQPVNRDQPANDSKPPLTNQNVLVLQPQ